MLRRELDCDLEGVDGDEDGADVSVDVTTVEPRPQILQERLLVEIRQLTQVRILPVLQQYILFTNSKVNSQSSAFQFIRDS